MANDINQHFRSMQVAEPLGSGAPAGTSGSSSLLDRYTSIRRKTEALCSPLETEDYVIQSMTDVSPVRWHIAHTTWFFETFVLNEAVPGYSLYDERYPFLFNSYYVQAGDRFARQDRGLLSRPTVAEVMDFRHHVDEHMVSFLSGLEQDPENPFIPVVEIGLNHEQQHQELMVYDIKHNFSVNPLLPAYHRGRPDAPGPALDLKWVDFGEGIRHIGHAEATFSYDNELPAHRVFLEPFQLANRLVTNREYLEFVESGGYRDQVLWLSEGWAAVEQGNWKHPLYWIKRDDGWFEFSMFGLIPLNPDSPLAHVSYFEADAYARWRDARLPTEFEWESAAREAGLPSTDSSGVTVFPGHFSDEAIFHAGAGREHDADLFGTLWEWTGSHYSPYPGYRAAPGALGEYNGKFMSNQFVLRGGSCATPRDHFRITYRNFFPPTARWVYSGIRLARSPHQ